MFNRDSDKGGGAYPSMPCRNYGMVFLLRILC